MLTAAARAAAMPALCDGARAISGVARAAGSVESVGASAAGGAPGSGTDCSGDVSVGRSVGMASETAFVAVGPADPIGVDAAGGEGLLGDAPWEMRLGRRVEGGRRDGRA